MPSFVHRTPSFAALLLAPLLVLSLLARQDRHSAAPARTGVVRGEGHAFVDDGGAFPARGATLFWAFWGYQHDRERLARNLQTLRGWGFDYIRALGVVGAPGDPRDSWRDRRIDPRATDYDRDIAALTDWAYEKFGLRVQWTIFGGTELASTPEMRRAVVRRFADMSAGREERLFAFEIANEAWQNGFAGEAGRAELRDLARALEQRTRVLVALSSPEGGSCAGARELYRGSAASLVTVHLPRAGLAGGAFWRALRDVWAFSACTGVPELASSNEPVGPESSVASVDDPTALAALAAVTYGSGIGAFVMHTGPGIRGGGEADLARGRHANFWELPTAGRVAASLDRVVHWLPDDVANWAKVDGLSDAPDRPFDVAEKNALEGFYCLLRGSEYACVAAGVGRPVRLTARRALTVAMRRFDRGEESAGQALAAGDAVVLPSDAPARLLTGRFR